MDAKPLSIAKLFRNSGQYVIPVFQRHYVWDKENQWEALWEDILFQARAKLDGVSKPHYCGAIVLDQKKQQGVDELARFDVIDGQQRLTTFQVILAALRDVARSHDHNELLKTLVPLLVNQNFTDLANPAADQFKLRPTRYDADQFHDTIKIGDRERLREKYASPKGRARATQSNIPKVIGAYLYFYDKISSAVVDRADVFGSDAYSEEAILDALVDSFIHFFQAVQIVLDSTDDAQIIFESLNSRGTPLLASDLMRNRIFLRAEQDKEPVEKLYETHWVQFEERFWTLEEKQGRLKKARLEFLMVNVLSTRTASEVHHNKIYQEYLAWLLEAKHSMSVERELENLANLAAVYRALVEAQPSSQLGAFGAFLKIFDVTTVYPFVMAAWTEGPDDDAARDEILASLESYLVRRQVCRRGTKNYNKIFLSAIKELRSKGFMPADPRSFLLSQGSESGDWPSDADFRTHWLGQPSYGSIPAARLVYILKRLEQAQRSQFSEDVTINSALSVEHFLPQAWYTHWPLTDGKFVTEEFARDARQHQVLGLHLDQTSHEAAQRQNLIDTFGNLTLLTHPLNSSVSNGPFAQKKKAITDQSALRLNRYFNDRDAWNEAAILSRGEELLADALSVWDRPSGG
jgi:hypothetical protein